MKIGISSCLLGNQVRYDGQHKLDRWLRDTLGRFVEWVPVCPEVECGLSIPREAMRLVETQKGAAPRLVTVRTKIDHTARMQRWIAGRLDALAGEELCGFIFKTKSPSSGMRDVKIYLPGGNPVRRGSGLFAAAFMRRFPLLPVEDEGRLHDDGLRENFIERIFVYDRWRSFFRGDGSRRGWIDFHTRHKLLMMAHSTVHLRRLGALVAAGRGRPPRRRLEEYQNILMEGMRLKATSRKNVNVLQHAMGYFKKACTADEKQELLEVIDHYHRELVPLIVPVTLLKHYIRRCGQSYLAAQHYFNPHPAELMLRNHV